jgi:hypothetical protein
MGLGMKRNSYIFMLQKLIVVTCGLILSLPSFCKDDHFLIASKMKKFFIQTLRETYGENTDKELYRLFLSDYNTGKKGDVALRINVNGLIEINKELFTDSVYFYYYPKLLFFDSDEELLRENENKWQSVRNSVCFVGKKDRTISKYGIYLNRGYFKTIVDNTQIKAIDDLYDYYSSVGFMSYFMFADIVLYNISDIENEMLKELTAVVFWKYLCDKKDINFYK